MPKPVELTARKLRDLRNLEDSRFLDLYEALIRLDSSLSDDDYADLLRFAVLFLRSEDETLARLGYRIILQYTEATGDYEPLHDLARVKELMPIVVAAERIDARLATANTFHDLLHQAHRTNFRITTGDGQETYRTRGQMELRRFNDQEHRAVIVAPTSYGKSEMLLDRVASALGQKICIIVPTRALIAQTRANLMHDARIYESRVRILTHPDAYTGEDSFIAVMTQERLQRLFTDQQELALDALLVDEAHALLAKESRAVDLAQVMIVAHYRNPNLAIAHYTPFMANPEAIKLFGQESEPSTKVINEHVKAEKFIYARPGNDEQLYDQFLNRFIPMEKSVPADEISAVYGLSGHRTLIYVNRPSQAQDLAQRMSARREDQDLSPLARRAITAISDLIDPSYSLIDGIRKGVLFHHGRVPDILRNYIEHIFREDRSSEPRYLVCTSTLLEGVNTPADRLILLTHKRGRRTLSISAFRNLMGRVGRFSEVFHPDRNDLKLLQPKIVLMPSSYSDSRWNIENYLPIVADLQKTISEAAENPLLAGASESEERENALDYLANIEPGAANLAAPRLAETEVGRLCFMHGVHDFDIFAAEENIQAKVDDLRRNQVLLTDMSQVLDQTINLFISQIDPEKANMANLARLQDNRSARNFYAAFLTWRTQNAPYKLLIRRFLDWWEQHDEEYVYVGSAWGEEIYGGGHVPLYVRMREKTRVERINLAVAKVKEENDFVDFNLMKYAEILASLQLLSEPLFLSLKYGTNNRYLIALLRTGFSPELARLVETSYREYVEVDTEGGSVLVMPALAEMMESNEENDVLVYEARSLAGNRH